MNPNNSNKPLVSVIVPVYKAGQYFDECGKDLYQLELALEDESSNMHEQMAKMAGVPSHLDLTERDLDLKRVLCEDIIKVEVERRMAEAQRYIHEKAEADNASKREEQDACDVA